MTTDITNLREDGHYPSKQGLSALIAQMDLKPRRESIKPGFIARTDGFDVDKTVSDLEHRIEVQKQNNPDLSNHDIKEYHLLSRLMSVSDLTSNLYERFKDNPNSMSNWLGEITHAVKSSQSPFKIPATSVHTLPIELAQFIRLEYQDTSQRDKDLFNEYIFDTLELEDDKTYFIKTGTFSSKFQFANAKCAEPREMGEYFSVINNFAMHIGAGDSVEVVVREYIEDVEKNPTIYNGMPLRTEFRAFVDFDDHSVIGVVPYWHPVVMKRALKHGLADSIQQDYITYQKHEDKLNREYNEHISYVTKHVKALLPDVDLTGRYSIDIMKNGDDFYIIDMALMESSALTELL